MIDKDVSWCKCIYRTQWYDDNDISGEDGLEKLQESSQKASRFGSTFSREFSKGMEELKDMDSKLKKQNKSWQVDEEQSSQTASQKRKQDTVLVHMYRVIDWERKFEWVFRESVLVCSDEVNFCAFDNQKENKKTAEQNWCKQNEQSTMYMMWWK